MGKYFYCIIKAKQAQRFKFKGIEERNVYSISAGNLCAVVSDSKIKEYILTREHVMAHQKVIEEVFKTQDVLPISFGTVVADFEELKQKILKAKARELLSLFKAIKGKIELGLKAFWPDMRFVFQEIAKNSQTIQRLRKSKKLTFQEKILAGELTAKLLEKQREIEKEKIMEPLRNMAENFKEDKLWGDDMILNTAFLIKKNKEKEFDKAINTLAKQCAPGIKFIYVGPLPPFNFIKLSL